MARARRAGELDELLLALLEREGRPLTGQMLIQMLRDEDEITTASLVFRALRKLVERGILHKLLTGRGYVRARAPREIYLHCTVCGTVGQVVHEASFDRIAQAAERSGFRVMRPIVEVAGRCARCSEPRNR